HCLPRAGEGSVPGSSSELGEEVDSIRKQHPLGAPPARGRCVSLGPPERKRSGRSGEEGGRAHARGAGWARWRPSLDPASRILLASGLEERSGGLDRKGGLAPLGRAP